MKSRCALGAVLLCVFAFWTSACSTSTPGLPGERDVTRTGDGFASMPTIPETASLLQRDGYLQGAMLGRRYDVVFQMLTAQCRAVIGSAQGVEGHLGTWEELPKNLGYDQQRDADIAVSKLLWKGQQVGLTWRREGGVWRLDTCDIG